MPFVKTDRALAALQDRSAGLRPVERQLLILCNGTRGADELRALFGPSADTTLQRLLGSGHLVRAEAVPVVAPPAEAPAAAVHDAGTSRRSMVAAKMYLVGILEMVRDPEAVACIRAIRAAGDEHGLVEQLHAALRFVAAKSPATYARKVAERLGETLPAAHLPALGRTTEALFAADAAVV